MVERETMRRVLEEHVEAENQHDRERVLATYVEEGAEFVDVPSGKTYSGDDGIIDNYRNLWDGFPGLVRNIERWTFGDDSCVIEVRLSGTQDGPYRGLPATGKKLDLPIIAHFEFDPDSGRIKRETAYYDTLTFRRQLGTTG